MSVNLPFDGQEQPSYPMRLFPSEHLTLEQAEQLAWDLVARIQTYNPAQLLCGLSFPNYLFQSADRYTAWIEYLHHLILTHPAATEPDDVSEDVVQGLFSDLKEIYTELGYTPTEIPSLIHEHNLYGAEICPRAEALASFALVMKAREVDRRFFLRIARMEHWQGPHIKVLEPVRLPPDSVQALQLLALQGAAEELKSDNSNISASPCGQGLNSYTRETKKGLPRMKISSRACKRPWMRLVSLIYWQSYWMRIRHRPKNVKSSMMFLRTTMP
jgi:hypothetical protein